MSGKGDSVGGGVVRGLLWAKGAVALASSESDAIFASLLEAKDSDNYLVVAHGAKILNGGSQERSKSSLAWAP